MLGGLPNGIFVASAANFVSEASTQNLRPMLSSVQGFCGLIGVTLGIATGFERIKYVNSGMFARRKRHGLPLALRSPIRSLPSLDLDWDARLVVVETGFGHSVRSALLFKEVVIPDGQLTSTLRLPSDGSSQSSPSSACCLFLPLPPTSSRQANPPKPPRLSLASIVSPMKLRSELVYPLSNTPSRRKNRNSIPEAKRHSRTSLETRSIGSEHS